MRLFVLPVASTLVALMAVGGYVCLGSMGGDARDGVAQQIAPAPEVLAIERLGDAPVDADAWQSAGRSLAAQGRHGQAVVAYRNAARLRPDDAALLTEYAFSAAVTSARNAEDEPQRLVQRALQLDPKSAKALALAGTLALDRSDYASAMQHWERLAELEPPDSPLERELRASIAQTRRLANTQTGRFELAQAH